jgi:hypothetical protein
MQQRPPSFGLNSAGLSLTMKAAVLGSCRPQPGDKCRSGHLLFDLNLAGLSPTMTAAAEIIIWDRFRRPHTYSASDSLKTAYFGRNSGGLSPTMNAAEATLF